MEEDDEEDNDRGVGDSKRRVSKTDSDDDADEDNDGNIGMKSFNLSIQRASTSPQKHPQYGRIPRLEHSRFD